NYQLVLNLETIRVPAGRHVYSDQGDSKYRFGIGMEYFGSTNKGTLELALTNTNLQPGDYEIVLKHDNGSTISPNVTSGNHLAFHELSQGGYTTEVKITNPAKASETYDIVFNLDEAGSLLNDTRNLGQIGGQRITVNDHVGLPTSDRDAYTFTT
ncbi:MULTISPECIES: hypothetical protein, partial [Spirulina sp. CCY15215]|uniref:hypothetical protein n=1 Tax=Spirulina sp. CCY15215 TaxID=2767591 RepID=UPI0019520812